MSRIDKAIELAARKKQGVNQFNGKPEPERHKMQQQAGHTIK